MFKPLILYIGLRYTRAKRRTRFISFITFISVLSIALGWIDLLAQESAGVGAALVLKHRLHSEAAYIATLAYGLNFGWRWRTANCRSATPLTLSLVGALLVALTGYLGGDLRSVM